MTSIVASLFPDMPERYLQYGGGGPYAKWAFWNMYMNTPVGVTLQPYDGGVGDSQNPYATFDSFANDIATGIPAGQSGWGGTRVEAGPESTAFSWTGTLVGKIESNPPDTFYVQTGNTGTVAIIFNTDELPDNAINTRVATDLLAVVCGS